MHKYNQFGVLPEHQKSGAPSSPNGSKVEVEPIDSGSNEQNSKLRPNPNQIRAPSVTWPWPASSDSRDGQQREQGKQISVTRPLRSSPPAISDGSRQKQIRRPWKIPIGRHQRLCVLATQSNSHRMQIPTVTAAWPPAEKAVSQHSASNTAKESSCPMCPLETR
ncbi:hypothetical protein ACLOJK_040471 [Asimina triloba]